MAYGQIRNGHKGLKKLFYDPKYLLKYFIYVKIVGTKVDQDQGGTFHYTINFDLEVNFQGQMEVRPFS